MVEHQKKFMCVHELEKGYLEVPRSTRQFLVTHRFESTGTTYSEAKHKLSDRKFLSALTGSSFGKPIIRYYDENSVEQETNYFTYLGSKEFVYYNEKTKTYKIVDLSYFNISPDNIAFNMVTKLTDMHKIFEYNFDVDFVRV